MTELLEHNLAWLAERDPALSKRIKTAPDLARAAVEPARSGLQTLIVNGISMHSRFDPVTEAKAFVNKALSDHDFKNGRIPAVFGMGLGYHILELAGRFKRIMVIEPDLSMIRLAFSYTDFTDVMPGLKLIVDRAADDNWPEAVMLPHSTSVRLWPKEFEYWMEKVGRRKKSEASSRIPGVNEIASLSRILNNGFHSENRGTDLELLAKEIEAGMGPLGDKPLNEGETLLLILNELAQV